MGVIRYKVVHGRAENEPQARHQELEEPEPGPGGKAHGEQGLLGQETLDYGDGERVHRQGHTQKDRGYYVHLLGLGLGHIKVHQSSTFGTFGDLPI